MPINQPSSEQAQRFREAARALECDDDADRFDARLKKVAMPPKPETEKPKPKGE